ncbi:aromatic acid/H+ symport family MFS transporter [Saxibacter everestensis]|uniref:Aromatic acid/H+ symport family MFS transporter n=1 Tax=Saxibacter everestensis TaxID=2909229 RepID=A0ABY8QPP5_9MICO|nr:aromatic acid/H+ symport family MFS transporter [Brevibacteriaceae bacterium ZFBP1038]
MATQHASSKVNWPVLLCWIAVALDGFDLVTLGAVIPTLLDGGLPGFTPEAATFISTVGLVGVGIGAVSVGPVIDSLGRRSALLASVGLFSVFTLLIAVSPNSYVFGTFRFIAGLGLGACLPTALTMISEYASPGRRSRATTRMMTGYHVGAVLTSLLAIILVPHWQLLFVIGGVAGLIVLAVMWFKLPETPAFRAVTAGSANSVTATSAAANSVTATSAAASSGAASSEARAAAGRATSLARRPFLTLSIAISVTSFMGLLLVYGLNTWLPQLMALAGYDLGQSLAQLLVLNVGAVIGLLIGGRVADRHGTKPSTLVWFGASAVFLALLSVRIDNTLLLYAAVLVTGLFVFSSQVLVYAFVTQLYPPQVRGRALGMAAGIGRIGAIAGPAITGVLVSAGIAYPWGFYVFALVAVLAVLALLFVPRQLPAAAGSSI